MATLKYQLESYMQRMNYIPTFATEVRDLSFLEHAVYYKILARRPLLSVCGSLQLLFQFYFNLVTFKLYNWYDCNKLLSFASLL